MATLSRTWLIRSDLRMLPQIHSKLHFGTLDISAINHGSVENDPCDFGKQTTLPEANCSPLKIEGWKMNFLLGPGLVSEVNSLLVT